MRVVVKERKLALKTSLGACCLDTGLCLDLAAAECNIIPGAVHHPDTDCQVFSCPAGACYPSDPPFECIPTDDRGACENLPGTFFSDGVCESRPCQFPFLPCTSTDMPESLGCWRIVTSICPDCSQVGTEVAVPCWVHDCIAANFGANVAFVVENRACVVFTPDDGYTRNPTGLGIFCPEEMPYAQCTECCRAISQAAT